MIDPEPKVGWVLRYNYLWSDDTNSVKERPAVVILAIKRSAGRILVHAAPVTHRAPADPARAMEIPAITKRRLGLDSAQSWIVLDYANEFVWPGPDLRPVRGKNPPSIYYGPLPPNLFNALRRQLLSLARARRQARRFRGE
jgi:hypothetical protein